MNLKEHFQSVSPVQEAAIGTYLSNAASTVGDMYSKASKSEFGKGVGRLTGGWAGVKKAIATQGIHTLTGIDPDEAERYYDKVMGSAGGELARKYLKAAKAEGILDYSAIDESDFVTKVAPTLEEMGNTAKAFFNGDTKLFALATTAVAKTWPSTTKASEKELSGVAIDIVEYFNKFEAKVKATFATQFAKHKIQFLVGTPEGDIVRNVLKPGGTGLSEDDFYKEIENKFLSLVYGRGLLGVQVRDVTNLAGIKFSPGNLIELYNALATLLFLVSRNP